jgi:GT2 family glycosyltransferase
MSDRSGPNEPETGGAAQRIAELESERDQLADAVRDRSEALVRAREQSRRSRLDAEQARIERDRAQQKLDRVMGHPVVRLGMFGLRAIREASSTARALRVRPGASVWAERQLTRSILEQLPERTRGATPAVSIVILNRDGAHHLRKLLPSLESLDYPDLEVILVDNASSDDSVAYAARHPTRHRMTIVENVENRSFAEANNDAVAQTGADLILFLNNDVRPLEANWLGWMVESVLVEGTVACGARLLIPRHRHRVTREPRGQADLELQHAGIQFAWLAGMPSPRNIGGPHAAAADLAGVHERPAATAACLLVRRSAFLGVGGFDTKYVYGYEDVDLCLRLREAGGRVVVDGRAVLWHDESATRRRESARAVQQQRQNREIFHARWGRELFRAVIEERLAGGSFLSRDPLDCEILAGEAASPEELSLARGLAGALERRGLIARVARTAAGGSTLASRSPDTTPAFAVSITPDVDVRECPGNPIKIACIRGGFEPWLTRPWIDDFDLLLTDGDSASAAVRDTTAHVAMPLAIAGPPDAIARSIVAAIDAWIRAPRVGILVQATGWTDAATSGDYHFARGLQRQFERRGWPTRVYLRPDWRKPVSTRDDVSIHLWGRYPVGPRPGQISLLWILYHPELVTDDLLLDYDAVLVASDRFAAELSSRTDVPIVSLHQATDPERFRPRADGPAHDLVFVGNSRGIRRKILDDITPTRHDLAVYGGGWEADLLDPAYLRGGSVANEDLPGYYGSAAIVLNDHWPEAAEAGFLNNRLYDALAAGGFVISDAVDGLDREFDGGVIAYSDAAQLVALVEHYLAAPEERRRRSDIGRRAVLERHTFANRVDEVIRLVTSLGRDLPAPLAPQAEVADAVPGEPARR